ncbi:MAG: adenylate/guanylate cyclase domain-containing protein [Ilumatobacteraceae bacterium]
MEQATSEIDLGNSERAVALAESAVALDPDNEDARAIVAFARVRARRRPAAADVSVASDAVAVPAEPGETSGDRRRLTVLFCDVVGSTELAGRLDPEDVRELLRAFQAAAANAIESYGGTVARFIGDGILAYFGFPTAHEDDAARAALAGRAMVAAVDALELQSVAAAGGWRLTIRVGIHTGLVVVADMGGGKRVEQHDIVGDAANVAARVQGEASPGQVLISEATLELARPFIEVEEHGTPPLKGVARPVTLYRVVGERRVPLRADASDGRQGPLVGRRDEQSVIADAWSVAADEGSVVFLHGHAGIGKSRLVAHATDVARAAGATVLAMQCASLRINESLWPADEAIRGFAAAATPEQRAVVDALPPADPDSTVASPAKQREERFLALIGWIDTLAASQRLLVVVEDLHWADATTVEFVQRLAARSPLGRFMLLLSSREPLPFLAPHLRALELQPLSADDCARIIDHLVEDPEQRSAVRDAVISRSDGVPLFINELTKVVVGSGSDSLEFGDDKTVPVALHDLLVARVDQFAEQRSVAQALAAFGQPTDATRLASVLDQAALLVVRDLDALEAGGLIRRVGDRYEFVHVLLREAVLRLQLRPQRRALHQRIATALDRSRGADTSVDDAIIAHHFSIAGENERAAQLWLRAGQHALRRNAQVEATELLRSALAAVEQMPESPQRTVAELDVVMALGPALINSKGYGAPDVEEVCLRAYELCEAVGDVPQRVPALINLWSFLASRAQHDEALELSATIMDLAAATGRDDLVLQANVCVGISNAFIGNIAVSAEHFQRAVDMYDASAHANLRFDYGTDPAVIAYSYMGNLRVFLGDEAGARALTEQGEALARSLQHPFSEVFALCFVSQNRILTGDLDDAERILLEANDLCSREAIPPIMPMTYTAVLQAFRKEPGAAEACEFATAIARMAGLLVNVPYIEAVHASALSERGDHDAAVAKIADSMTTMAATNERWSESEILRRRAEILERSGADAADVEAAYRDAIDVAQRMAAPGFEALAQQELSRWLAR